MWMCIGVNVVSVVFQCRKFLFVFRLNQEEKGSSEPEQHTDYLIPPAFLDRFSTQFCLEITSRVVESVAHQPPAGLEQMLAAFQPDQTGSNQIKLDEAAASYGSVPNEKLWQEILFNLRKDVKLQGCARLTAKDVAELAPGDGLSHDTAGNRVSVDCVAFSCGHHYRRQDLKRHVATTWGNDMEALPVPLPVTQRALQAIYTDETTEDKTLPGACPRCVHSAILGYQKE